MCYWRGWLFSGLVVMLCGTHHVLTQTCTKPDGTLFYVSSPLPTTDPFSNTDTLGPGCSTNPSGNILECHSVFTPPPILLDGVIGQEQGPPSVSTINAWSRSQSTVTITFVTESQVQVRHIRLYFYNIPSMNIGLPEVTLMAGGPQEYFVTGNQNLNSTDNRRRNFILSYTNSLVMTNTFQIIFGFTNRTDVNWLLLSEVEFCQSIDRVLSPTSPPELVPGASVTRSPEEVSSNFTLSCTVRGDGKFSWSWTGPQSPAMEWTSDFTRTSTALFTSIRRHNEGKYACQATYDPMIPVTGGGFLMPASQNFTIELQYSFEQISPIMRSVIRGEIVTLSCEIYGYLSSSPDIIWSLVNPDTVLSSDSTYTITTRDGNRLIQNGGLFPSPSFISDLTFTHNTSQVIQIYTCAFLTFQKIFTLTSTDATAMPGSGTTENPTTMQRESTPISIDMNIVIYVATSLVVLILIVVIAIVIVVVLIKRHSQNKFRLAHTNRKNSLDYNGDAIYQEMPQPAPPPLPSRFPGQDPELDEYASIDTKPNGYFEMSEKVKKASLQHSTVSSTGSGGTEKLPFLERNPIYDSSDQLDESGRRSTTKSPKNWNTSSNEDCQLNIYARPCHLKPPPIPQRLPSPEPIDEPLYSEADFKPSLFAGSRPTSITPTSVTELPCVSIYDNPEPLIRSEGPKEIFPGNVQEVKDLGVGQFGEVVLAKTVGLSLKDLQIDEDDGNKNVTIYVAVKKLKNSADNYVKEAFEKEIKFMSRLRNKNVIRLLAICTSSNPFIVMEYMPNGDLNQFLQDRKLAAKGKPPDLDTTLARSDLVYICLQIASGMKYLATFRFIHRDLATRNCLVGDNLTIKIADFGMSRSLYSSYYYRISGRAMLPIRWMANECFYGKFSEKTDVWAFAVTVWEVFMFAREQPYDEMTDQEIIDDAIKGPDRKLLPRPEHCPVEVYEVMKRCWVDEPSERTKFNEVHSLLEAIYEYGSVDEL